MITLYGIKNCDTVKKAQKWLAANNIQYQFHDFKTSGLPETLLTDWLEMTSWEQLVNKRSTTYRALPPEIKENLDKDSACQAMLAQPTLVKRPVLVINQTLTLGFKPEQYQEIFS